MPAGFRAGGLAAGIKASGRPDLGVVVATDGPAAAAAVFTPNAFAAAPVRLSREHLAATSGDRRGGFGWARAIISTSGAPMRRPGRPATRISAEIAHPWSRRGPGDRRGPDTPPLDRGHRHATAARPGRSRACARSSRRSSRAMPGSRRLAEALRTTDSVTKVATTVIDLPDVDGRPVTVTVSGIAKGVGMIHPRMATMLAVVLTDAAAAPETLWGLLRPAAARTWDQLSRRRRHEHQRHGVRPRVGGVRGGTGPRRQSRGRDPGARRSRPSPATSPASRPPTARAQRR